MTEGLSDIHLLHDDDECDTYHPIAKEYPQVINYCIPTGISLMQKINVHALDIASKYKYIGFVGDDIVFKTPFEKIFIEYLSSIEHGMIYGRDMYRNQPTHPFMTSKTVLAVGFFGLPIVKHNYFDNYWDYIFNELKTKKHEKNVIMEHIHPAAGKEISDEVSNRIYESMFIDVHKFRKYITENIFSDIDKIIKYEEDVVDEQD